MANPEEIDEMPERRLVIIGARGHGKSSAANTILTKKRFESCQTQTLQAEARHGIVEGRHLVLVDTPGWKCSPSLNKQQIKLYASKCQPGPHAFLLVVPTDASFSQEEEKAMLDYMKLLGNRVWSYTMVLFTFGDYLGNKTIEQHIESEGAALTWLIGKCNDRYHMFNNKDESNLSQVIQLLEKIDDMVRENNDGYYMLGNSVFHAIQKRDEVAKKAEQRFKQALKQQEELNKTVSGPTKKLHEIKILILGQKKSGKTTAANLILRDKFFSTQPNHGCMAMQALVADRQVTVVDTPGWAEESQCTWEQDRKIVSGLNLSPQGVDAVLIVLSLDLKFRKANHDALVDHIMLFGDKIWNHTMVLFTNENTLADKSLEEYIEKEDQALRQLVDKCGNNYHCLNIFETRDDTQHVQLFKKIEDMSAKNQGRLFCPNMNDIYRSIDEKFQKRKIIFHNRVVQAFTSQRLALLRDHKTKLEKLQDNIKEISPSPSALNEAKKTSVLSDIEEQIDELSMKIMKLNKLTSSIDILPPTLSQSTTEMDKVLEWMSQLQGNTDEDCNSMLNMSESSGYRSPPVFPLDD